MTSVCQSDNGLKVVSVVALGYQGISININNGARADTRSAR